MTLVSALLVSALLRLLAMALYAYATSHMKAPANVLGIRASVNGELRRLPVIPASVSIFIVSPSSKAGQDYGMPYRWMCVVGSHLGGALLEKVFGALFPGSFNSQRKDYGAGCWNNC